MNSYKTFTIFGLLCFAIALPCFFIIYNNPQLHDPMSGAALPLWLGMVWSPSLAAIVMRLLRKEKQILLQQLTLPGSWQAYGLLAVITLIPVGSFVLLRIIADGPVFDFFSSDWSILAGAQRDTGAPQAYPLTWQLVLLLPLLHLIMGPLGEELGWRGLALQSLLQARLHIGTASLLVGLLWAVWHFPLWLLPEAPQASIPLWVFCMHVLCYALLMGLVYIQSRASIWPCILLHLLLNYSTDLICLTTGITAATYYQLSLPLFLLFTTTLWIFQRPFKLNQNMHTTQNALLE